MRNPLSYPCRSEEETYPRVKIPLRDGGVCTQSRHIVTSVESLGRQRGSFGHTDDGVRDPLAPYKIWAPHGHSNCERRVKCTPVAGGAAVTPGP